MSLSWLYLVIAGISEIVWALGMKYTDGFTKILPSSIVLLFMLISVICLALAIKEIPISVAYAIWVGIGTMGAVIGGMLLFKEEINLKQLICLALIIIGIIGLKLFTAQKNLLD